MTLAPSRLAPVSAALLVPFLLLWLTSPSSPAAGQERLVRAGTTAQLDSPSDALLVQLAPRPRDLVRVTEGTPYVVPRGRVLVLENFGVTGSNRSEVTLLIDGVPALNVDLFGSRGVDLGIGVAAQAGETVSVESGIPDPTSLAVALGYLGNS